MHFFGWAGGFELEGALADLQQGYGA